MSNIFEIFNPSDRHWKEQRDFDKVHVFTTKKGGRGPMQVDLDDKTIVLPTSTKADPAADRPIKRGSQRSAEKSGKTEKAADENPGGDAEADPPAQR